jgi:hypothetical protein
MLKKTSSLMKETTCLPVEVDVLSLQANKNDSDALIWWSWYSIRKQVTAQHGM